MRPLFGCILLFFFVCLIDVSATESAPMALEFRLFDQYGKSYEIIYPRDKTCVLVFADKWGCTQVEGWVRPLYERYQDTIAILGVAQLDGVPKWLRSTLVRIFKRSIKFSVMMDWTGEVCMGYAYPGGNAYVVIVNPQGAILHQVQGKASQKLLEECWRVIDASKTDFPAPVSPKDKQM
jgi:hypothetical protein